MSYICKSCWLSGKNLIPAHFWYDGGVCLYLLDVIVFEFFRLAKVIATVRTRVHDHVPGSGMFLNWTASWGSSFYNLVFLVRQCAKSHITYCFSNIFCLSFTLLYWIIAYAEFNLCWRFWGKWILVPLCVIKIQRERGRSSYVLELCHMQ